MYEYYHNNRIESLAKAAGQFWVLIANTMILKLLKDHPVNNYSNSISGAALELASYKEFNVLGVSTIRYCSKLLRDHTIKLDGDFLRAINPIFLFCLLTPFSRLGHEPRCNSFGHQLSYFFNEDSGSSA